MDRIESLNRYKGLAQKLFPKTGLFQIEPNKPVTFHVLCDEYSSKGVWVHPVGVHFIKGRQIVCARIEEAAEPCHICKQIDEMRAGGVQETRIFQYLAPRKYAMNILVRGEEIPHVYLAPPSVAEPIIRDFERALEDDINIFDPLKATAYTVTRSKADGGRTEYHVEADPVPSPIITGDDLEIRIARILRRAANLDRQFRLSSLQEQKEAWSRR